MAKVLFQATNPRVFRATLIGYLYEIVQKHNVVLLADGLDEETRGFLQDKTMFPGLGGIVYFKSPFGGDIVRKNVKMYQALKNVVKTYKPDIVVAPSDMWPAEMYLLRLAKHMGATTLALQSGFKIADQKNLLRWAGLMSAHTRMPKHLPFSVRMILVKAKKILGYALYHFLLPLMVGERPFWGKISFVFWHESSGQRDADYAAVFSKRDFDVCVRDGVKKEKLFVIGHPLEHPAARNFFEKTYFAKRGEQKEVKTMTIMWPEEKVAFRQEDYSSIPRERLEEKRSALIKRILEQLPDWKIFIKPHPSEKETIRIKETLEAISSNIVFVDPLEPADKYIAKSSVICGMPLPSTTLFTAQKQHSEIIILSLNLDNEFLGDSYKDFEGIEYIDTEEKLVRVLDAIREGSYRKETAEREQFDFEDAAELVNHISAYAKRIS